MTTHTELQGALDTIRSTAERMRADSRFKCIFEEITPATNDDISEWEEWAHEEPGMSGYRLPTALRALYSVTGGFRWRWQYLPDLPSTITTGSAELVDLLSLYQSEDDIDQPLSMIYRAPRRFDVLSEQEYVAIRFAPDSNASLPLIHVDEEESTRADLSLRIEEYLPTLARYRATYGWQSMFHKQQRGGDRLKSQLDATVSRLFP